MPVYTHGGDVLTAQAACGGEVLDFSANLNPLGMPEAVEEAARDAAARCAHYPDPLCRELRQVIAAHDGVKEEQVVCGNGAADLILRLAVALRPRKALVTAPTFSEYEQALSWVGCEMVRYTLDQEKNFDLDSGFLEAIGPGLDLVFLCTPNNPGRWGPGWWWTSASCPWPPEGRGWLHGWRRSPAWCCCGLSPRATPWRACGWATA